MSIDFCVFKSKKYSFISNLSIHMAEYYNLSCIFRGWPSNNSLGDFLCHYKESHEPGGLLTQALQIISLRLLHLGEVFIKNKRPIDLNVMPTCYYRKQCIRSNCAWKFIPHTTVHDTIPPFDLTLILHLFWLFMESPFLHDYHIYYHVLKYDFRKDSNPE